MTDIRQGLTQIIWSSVLLVYASVILEQKIGMAIVFEHLRIILP